MSRTKKTKSLLLTLVAGFALTLGAGMVVGMAAGRHEVSTATTPLPLPTTTQPSTPGRVPPLSEALGLTKEQGEQMKAIWSDVQASFHKNNERRAALVKKRDEALYSLLSDEQKALYEKLTADYAAQLNDLANEQNKEREKAFQDAVEKTKKILNETQRQKYEQLLKEHGPPWHRGEHGEHGGRGGPPGGFGPPNHGGPRGDHPTGWSAPGHNPPRFGDPRPEHAGPRTQPAEPLTAPGANGGANARGGAGAAGEDAADPKSGDAKAGEVNAGKATSRPAGVAP